MTQTIRRRTGFTVVDGVTIAGAALIAFAVVLPRARVAKLLASEDDAIADLADIEQREEAHRTSAATDADHDGRGEFAPLAAVLGPRAHEFQRVGSSDTWRRNGYYFAVLLPDARLRAAAPTSSDVRTDYAEVAELLVAWPVEPGVTGMRAYARWPGGILLQHIIDGFPYTMSPPIPNAPLVIVDAKGPRHAERYEGEDWKPPLFNAAQRKVSPEPPR